MPGPTWPRWNWLEDWLQPLLGALMWATWLAVPIDGLLAFVTDQQASGGAGPAVVALLLGGTAAARVARPLRQGRALVAIGGLVAVVAAVWWLLYREAFPAWDARWLSEMLRATPGPLTVVLVGALLWWRGLTADWSNHDQLARDFVIGVIALGGSLALTASSPESTARLLGSVLLFLVTAWATLSLAAVMQASRRDTADDRPLRLSRYWLLAVITLIAALLAAGLLLTRLATPEALAHLLATLQPVLYLGLRLLLYVLYAAAYVVFLFLTPLIALLRRLAGPNAQPLPNPPPPFQDLLDQSQTQPAALAPWAETALRGGLVVALLVVVGVLLGMALRRFAATDDEGVRESRELIWSLDLLRAQLADLLARRRAPRPALFVPLAGDRLDPLVRIRAAYRRLLALAVRRGQPRQPGQSPRGYLPVVEALWPAEPDLLTQLTEAYTRARYGEAPPAPDILTGLEAGLEQLANHRVRSAEDGHAR